MSQKVQFTKPAHLMSKLMSYFSEQQKNLHQKTKTNIRSLKTVNYLHVTSVSIKVQQEK